MVTIKLRHSNEVMKMRTNNDFSISGKSTNSLKTFLENCSTVNYLPADILPTVQNYMYLFFNALKVKLNFEKTCLKTIISYSDSMAKLCERLIPLVS